MKKVLQILCTLLLFGCGTAFSQSWTLTGKVTDAKDGSNLPGVSILVKGTTNGTVTDIDGNYSISVTSGVQLVFSFVGYDDYAITLGNQKQLNVALTVGLRQLSEVVVVGFGSQIKRDLTGNIVKLKGKELENIPVSNFNQAIQGRAAGVFIESESGRVGEGLKIRIRGASSISASNQPLFVIDGIPVNTTGLNSGNSMADLNTNDIESIQILKDASASAIFGSKAANGVVLITTKKGKVGKTDISLNYQVGFSEPTGKREWLNRKEYIELFREAAVGAGKYDFAQGISGYASEQEAIDDYKSFVEGRFKRYSGGFADWESRNVDTDWQGKAFQKNTMHALDLSANGGNEKFRYYASGSYLDQPGIIVGNKFNRITGRLNVSNEVNSWLKLGMNLSSTRTLASRIPEDNQFANPLQIVALCPLTPVRDSLGRLYNTPTTTYYNPLMQLENASQQSTTYRTLGTAYGNIKLGNSLNFMSEFGVDQTTQNDEQFNGSLTESKSVKGRATSDWVRILYYTTNNYFTYNKKLNANNDLEATAGMAFSKRTRSFASVTGEGFTSDDLQTVASAAKIVGGSSDRNEYAIVSYFARANYKLMDRYLLTLSGRIDGSSRFGPDRKYGFFPAASAGWIVTEEPFLKSNKTLSYLKVRMSYGLTGNDEFANYQYLGLYNSVRYAGVSGLGTLQLANPELRWEKSGQGDLGIEFGFFNDRITGELDLYQKNTSDLLYQIPVPGTSGFSTRFQNIGSIENKGIELVLNATPVATADLKWTVSFNFARNQNKVTRIDGSQDTIPSTDTRYLNALIVGQPIGVFFGAKYAGVDPANGDALYYSNKEGTTTTNDFNKAARVIVGDPNPDFIGGINNTVSFRGLELSFLFQGVFGNQIFKGGDGFMAANGDWFDNQTKDQLNRWQKPGDITNVPAARLGFANGTGATSRYVADGTYVRLKTVSLSYNFPREWTSRIHLNSLRVYAVAQNLLTFTKYDGWDPEVNSNYRSTNINQGADFYSPPQMKTITFGVNVGF